MKTSICSAALALLLSIDTVTASCGHGTSFHKRKVVYKRAEGGNETVGTVAVGNFGYLGSQGPTQWQNLAVENALCSTSAKQSPIDINMASSTVVDPGALILNFPNVETAEFENLGTTIEVVMEGKGANTVVGGKVFNLKQFHFHTPGEHTIDGTYFPLEMHMVHEAEDKSIAVIAVPFQLAEDGSTTSLLTSLLPGLPSVAKPGSITATGPLDFAPFVAALGAQSFRQYQGSLTTPPCAEGLEFFVATVPQALDVKTYNAIKGVVGFNARFIQNPIGLTNLLVENPLQGVAAPVAVPVPEPVAAPIAEPVPAPIAEPVPSPIAEPVPAPIAEPIAAPVVDPVAAPVRRRRARN